MTITYLEPTDYGRAIQVMGYIQGFFFRGCLTDEAGWKSREELLPGSSFYDLSVEAIESLSGARNILYLWSYGEVIPPKSDEAKRAVEAICNWFADQPGA